MRELIKRFVVTRERTAENWFVNKVDTKFDCMSAARIRNVVAELILLLVALRRKEGNRRGELVIAESLKSRNSECCRTERKGQSESKIRIALLCEVQGARAEDESA